MATTSREARELAALAKSKGLVLAVYQSECLADPRRSLTFPSAFWEGLQPPASHRISSRTPPSTLLTSVSPLRQTAAGTVTS